MKWKRRREKHGQSLIGVQGNDRLFRRDSCFKNANVQPKAVFSCAMTVMDKICGWEDEERWVGSKFAKRVLTFAQRPDPGMEEYLKQRSLSIMLCMNWVCAGVFDDHEWVSESTIAEQEEEVMGRELDYEICIPCVVHWCMLWFSAPPRFNQTLGRDIKNQKISRSREHRDRRSDLYAILAVRTHCVRTC